MRPLTLAALALLALAVGPAAADEFTDVLESALKAYRDGDVAGAREDLDYAVKLLGEAKAASLATFLPAAPAGWTKEAAEAEGAGMAMAMFGGGTAAAATYRREAAEFTLTLVANSPMVSAISAMVSGVASIAGTETRRIQRVQFAVNEGDLQGVVDGKVLVSASGTAPVDEMAAVIETMDLRALGTFEARRVQVYWVRASALSSVRTSAAWLRTPVLSKMRCSWVRTVLTLTPS